MFMGQIPSAVDGINHIFSMSVSRNGDIYVVIPAYQFVLKYNKKGNVTDRIPLVADPATILETSHDRLIITHHSLRSTVCLYTKDPLNSNIFISQKLPSFFL